MPCSHVLDCLKLTFYNPCQKSVPKGARHKARGFEWNFWGGFERKWPKKWHLLGFEIFWNRQYLGSWWPFERGYPKINSLLLLLVFRRSYFRPEMEFCQTVYIQTTISQAWGGLFKNFQSLIWSSSALDKGSRSTASKGVKLWPKSEFIANGNPTYLWPGMDFFQNFKA